MAAARIAGYSAHQLKSFASMRPQTNPRALLLDAMGTLLTFEPPAPRLRAAVRAATGADIGEAAARRAIRAEIAYYRAHLHLGAGAAGLAELRRNAAEAMRPELPDPARGLPATRSSAVLVEALRFRAYPEVPGTLRALRRARNPARRRLHWDVSLHERLAELELTPLLDGAIASAEFGAAKPDPAIFAAALELPARRGGRLARRRLPGGRRGRRAAAGVRAGARRPRRRPRAARRRGGSRPLDGLLSLVE